MMNLLFLLFGMAAIRTVGAVLCEVGEALRDPSNPTNDLSCNGFGGGQTCPGDYACTSIPTAMYSVCCPSKNSICSQPQSPGSTCGSSTPSTRYYFDQYRGSCQMFTYNGCYGNTNNFYSSSDCERACLSRNNQLCPINSTPAPGTTGANPCTLATFCPQGYSCQYGQGQMQAYCCSTGGQSSQYCPAGSTPAFGPNGATPCNAYTTCPSGYMCQPSQFGGGQSYCCSQSSTVNQMCPLGSSPAPGLNTQTPCNQFTCTAPYSCQYSATYQQSYCCSSMSASTLCPSGTTPAPGTTVDRTCSAFANTCPFGYTCQAGPNWQSYCCSTSSQQSQQVCPTGSTGPNPSGPTSCDQNSQCPPGFTCQYSIGVQRSFCCSGGNTGLYCPIGTQQSGTQPCQSNAQCPYSYTCQQTSNGLYYCCSTNQSSTSQLCPIGSNPAPGVSMATSCSQFSPCPLGYSCQYSSTTGQSYCCSSGGTASSRFCPAGSTAAPGFPQTCTQFGNTCPAGYTCQQSPLNLQRWYCCRSTTSNQQQLCPTGSTPALGTTWSSICNAFTSCPQGYACSTSPANGQSYCCRQTGRFQTSSCPSGMTQVLNGGSIASCGVTPNPQPELCPPLSLCLLSTSGQSYVCCFTNRRITKMEPSASCKSDEDCDGPMERCVNGKCQCSNGLNHDGTCLTSNTTIAEFDSDFGVSLSNATDNA